MVEIWFENKICYQIFGIFTWYFIHSKILCTAQYFSPWFRYIMWVKISFKLNFTLKSHYENTILLPKYLFAIFWITTNIYFLTTQCGLLGWFLATADAPSLLLFVSCKFLETFFKNITVDSNPLKSPII